MAYNYASQGINMGMKLVDDIRAGRISFQSPYKFTEVPTNEEKEHQRFIKYLESNLGFRILRVMRWEEERYLFI